MALTREEIIVVYAGGVEAVIAVIELADRRNCAVVAQRQAVLRNAATLLGHELVLYAV